MIKLVIGLSLIFTLLSIDVTAQVSSGGGSLYPQTSFGTPQISIDFVKRATLRRKGTGDIENRVFFRLRNDSVSTIRISTGTEEVQFGEMRLSFDVVTQDGLILYQNRCHICTIVRLSPRRSVLFSVEEELLEGGDYFQTPFGLVLDKDASERWAEFKNTANYPLKNLPKKRSLRKL